MSKKDFGAYLFDIIRSVLAIQEYTKGQDFQAFSNDQKTFDAVMRNFQIIGEAIKKIPYEVLKPYDAVSWKEIKGMREDLNGRVDGLSGKVERLEHEQAKTNFGIGELRLSVMKLADFADRILRLEKEVFKKAS